MLTNPQLNIAENVAGSLEFDIDPEHPLYDSIEMMVSEIIVYRDGDEIWSGRPVEVKTNFFGMKSIYCEGALAYLNDTIQEPTQYKVEGNNNIYNWIALRLQEHNRKAPASRCFYIGRVTVTEDDVLYRYTNYESTLDCILDKLVNRLGGHLQIRRRPAGGFYLDYLKDYEGSTAQTIRFGLNLLEYSRTLTRADIATVCVPFGVALDEKRWDILDKYLDVSSKNNGSIYIESAQGVANFGRIIKVMHWNEITTAAALKSKAIEWLNNAQYDDLKLEVNAMDFHLADSNVEGINLLDEVRVVSPPHGLDRYYPVTEMKIPLDNPAGQVFTLGASERISLTAKTNNGLKDLADEMTQTASSVLIRARENATELITSGALGGHVVVLPDEIYVGDNDDIDSMRRLWRWNKNGLGYSSTGRNGSYNTAITADGQIVADRITTGILSADRMRGGTLALGGSQYGDFKNGSLRIYNAIDQEIGRWDSGGIQVSKGKITGGTIQGATIFAGGSNNTEGTITVKSATGAVIGSWNSSGINIKSGTLTLGSKFSVAADGTMKASGATFSGNISASNISGGKISGTAISGSTFTGAKLTLGGKNLEEDGYIMMRGADGTQIGKWNYEGLRVSKGVISGTEIKGNAISGGTISGTTINGSTIAAKSKITGSTIIGNTITLGGEKGGAANKNGTLTVYNADSEEVVKLSQNGITIKAGTLKLGNKFSVASDGTLKASGGTFTGSITGGSINGANITLGGAGNASGQIVIKNGSKAEIGRWNKDGITMKSGKISSSNDDVYFDLTNGVMSCSQIVGKYSNRKYTMKIGADGATVSINSTGDPLLFTDTLSTWNIRTRSEIQLESRYTNTSYVRFRLMPQTGFTLSYYNGSSNQGGLEIQEVVNDIYGSMKTNYGFIPRNTYATATPTSGYTMNNRIAVESSSSIRYKHNIRPLSGDRDARQLLSLPVREFEWNEDHALQYDDMKGQVIPGIIAEDVARIYPSAVIHDKDGQIESWDERRIIPGMLALIQDLYQKIEGRLA